MKRESGFLIVAIACAANTYAQSLDELRGRSIDAYWTDAAPTLDGKMDDVCWKEAVVAGDFRTFQKPMERASQQTEVRVCYDAKNLYIFYTLHEERMDKLFYGPPEDLRDMLNFSGDVAELFLDPGRTKKRKYQLCASPLGTRYDGGPGLGRRFNPDWQVKPRIFDDHWTLEMAIPFAELALDGEYHATPQKGDVWGIQFCRDQAHLHEWSQWVPTPMSFHETDKFGTIVFQGRRSGPALPTVRCVDPLPVFFGKGSLDLAVSGAAGDTQATYSLRRDTATQRTDKVAMRERCAIPYHISESGKWSLNVELRRGDQFFYVGHTFSVLPPADEMLADIEANVTRAKAKLAGFRHPSAQSLRQKVLSLEREARQPTQMIKRAKGLSRAEWQQLLDGVKGLEKTWQQVEFDLHLVQIYPQGEQIRAFAVGAAGPHEKIYRDTLHKGDLDAPARVALAGEERESFQLVLVPFWTKLDSVRVTFSDLKGEAGAIPSDHIRHHIVDYVRLSGVEPDHPTLNVHEPDILWPGKPFNVARGQVQSVYVDVHCPAGTPAGEYVGKAVVEANGQRVEKRLVVRVYGFDLPKVASLENNFWFCPADYNWGRFYGLGVYGKTPYSLEIYKKQAAVLSRYRVTPFCDAVYTMLPFLTAYREPDGRFTFDFSKWAEFIRVGLEHDGNSWRASLSCNLGAMGLFKNVKVIDRVTGEEKYGRDYAKEWTEAYRAGEAHWDTHPIYPQYLKAYIAFLKEMGLFDMAHFEIYDEPNSNPRWLDMIRHHKWLRRHVPELKLTAYGMEPLRRQAGKGCAGLCDVWAPNLRGITPDVLRAMKERRAKYGEKYWFYTCGEAQDKDGNPTPYLRYERSYLAPRIHAWYAWQLEADGMLIFAMNSVPKENVKTKARDQQWPNAEWLDGRGRGCGVLIYPGPNYEVIPSMRLASVRDGLEDYEYLKILHGLSAYVDPVEQQDLLQRIERELQISKDIIDGYYSWTRDVGRLEQKRERLAALIVEAKKLLD